jgi:Ca2+-binding RTX toxin-like protein
MPRRSIAAIVRNLLASHRRRSAASGVSRRHPSARSVFMGSAAPETLEARLLLTCDPLVRGTTDNGFYNFTYDPGTDSLTFEPVNPVSGTAELTFTAKREVPDVIVSETETRTAQFLGVAAATIRDVTFGDGAFDSTGLLITGSITTTDGTVIPVNDSMPTAALRDARATVIGVFATPTSGLAVSVDVRSLAALNILSQFQVPSLFTQKQLQVAGSLYDLAAAVTFTVDFGDGTQAQQTGDQLTLSTTPFPHTYGEAGTYTVTATMSQGDFEVCAVTTVTVGEDHFITGTPDADVITGRVEPDGRLIVAVNGVDQEVNPINRLFVIVDGGADMIDLSAIGFNDPSLGRAVILGGDGDDVITGTQGSDVIDGGNGSDQINGHQGNDTIQVVPGLDRDVDTIDGGGGDDLLAVFSNDIFNSVQVQSSGSQLLMDLLSSTTEQNLAATHITELQYLGTTAEAEIFTLLDSLADTALRDITVSMQDGPNTFDGSLSSVNQTFLGNRNSSQPDNASLGGGMNRFFGYDGPNTVSDNGGSTVAYVDGDLPGSTSFPGAGDTDWLNFINTDIHVSVDLTQTSQAATSNHHLIGNLPPNIIGGRGDDMFIGDARNNQFFGGAGNDVLQGGDGDDILGSADASLLEHLLGALIDGTDVMIGGDGNDIISTINPTSVSEGHGDDTVIGKDTSIQAVPGSDDLFIVFGAFNGLDFGLAEAGITFNLDLQNTPQTVDVNDNTVEIRGTLSTFFGSTFDDTLTVTALPDVTRTVFGGSGTDTLIVDAQNQPVMQTATTVTVGMSATITHGGFETVVIQNEFVPPLVIDLSEDDDSAELIDNGDGTFTLEDFDGTFGGDITFMPPASGVVVNALDGFDVIDFSAATFPVVLNGGGDDDELIGGTQNDTLNGGDGDDTLTGFLGADEQSGGVGDDTFTWANGDGPDDNFGGEGDDSLSFSGADGARDELRLAPASDGGAAGDGTHPTAEFDLTRTLPSAFTIENSGIENVVVNGLAGDDLLDASALPDGLLASVFLLGGDGDDELLGSQGSDALIGNDGHDTLIGNQGADLILGDSDASFEFPTGDTGDDTFIWNNGDGADDVDLEFGNDTFIFNGADGGADVIRIAPAADVGEAGDGTLANASVDLTRTAPSAFTIELVNVEHIEVNGLGGHDTVDASPLQGGILQTTRMDGGDGDDQLVGTPRNDTLVGASGDDTLSGRDGDDILTGGAGSDVLNGGAGNDRLRGQGASGDQLTGGAGDDELNGGAGTDRVQEEADVDFTATDAALTGLGSDALLGIELLTLNGGGSANRIDTTAFSGDVVLNGRGGNDTLLAGDGNDILNGGGGRDRLHGGAGNDRVRGQGSIDELSGGPGNDIIDGGAGNDRMDEEGDVDFVLMNTQLLGLGTDVLIGIQRATLRGGASNNRIDASRFSGPVSLLGFGGDDVLIGGAFADQLRGSAGRDTLIGNDGNDALFGQGSSGDDLDGGNGADTLDGGSGRDRIRSEPIDTVVSDALDIILMS